ncbi:RSP_7527 family protein [Motiliproteus sp. MSK22-1]|uniref:RSP_7527 family protein n=1 Tax=Motiliproteus sp. MSK22-1 TaxID=1897630 RepID=UPI0009755750|nr:hypothetical protein [Motiliproteus sp. MSK22-1]OMH30074.1 hypothetical protein BGP75_19280 [Motiliproteus sp. MSK22-1]
MNNQGQSLKQANSDQYQVEMKLNEYGSIDVDYYRARAESLRADYLKGLFVSVVSKLKKSATSIDLGNLSAPKANIVSSQKLTLSI